MQIKKVLASKGYTGFYFDDQAAVKGEAKGDGATYIGEAKTPGFSKVRQAGESISIMIILENDQIAYGDCAAVQYSGAGGRDPLFLADDFLPVIKAEIAPRLEGRKVDNFKELAAEFDCLKINGKRMHTALRYGITQALLSAVAQAKNKTMAEIVAEEYDLELDPKPVPVFSQTGDSRHLNADKMIIKQAEVIPHGLINHVEEKLGKNGEKLKEYVNWLKNRIKKIAVDKDYHPAFHLDVYGTIGVAFDNDPVKMADYLAELAAEAEPYDLRIEGPMDSGSREAQIKDMKALKDELARREIPVELVADEWCNTLEDIKLFVDHDAADVVQIKTPDLGGINNTIEAVMYCKENNVGAYQGGTCNETDRSSRVCVNLALATQPDQVLAKPGMGVDEAIMIVKNEMNRILEILKYKDEANK